MAFLFYVRLIALTAGTLVYLFLIALVLGHRRPRKFERLLFFLIFSLFLIYAGGLLEINARIEYGSPPDATRLLYTGLITLGMLFLPVLCAHVYIEYQRTIRRESFSGRRRAFIFCSLCFLYAAPVILFIMPLVLWVLSPELQAIGRVTFSSLLYASNSSNLSPLVLVALLSIGADFHIAKTAVGKTERRFFGWLAAISFLAAVPMVFRAGIATLAPVQSEGVVVAIIVAGVLPGALLIYFALRHNFLDFGAQRNLVYALSAMFLALLYLTLVHRVSGWLEPVLPPEATASILLFVLIFLFEPVERAIGPTLHRRFKEGMDGMHRLAAELQAEARLGDVARLTAFAERRIGEGFGLAIVRLSVPGDAARKLLESPGGLGHVVRIPLVKDGKEMGVLEAASTGTYLTGETSAALEYLAEQLPAMLDLARLIEDKVRLERELAARERLAMLGQMAASVSHNLRNPLSSMKTVLQVQLENPDLPQDVRDDCSLVVREIDRMSEKLKQLLNFAKPSANGQRFLAASLARQTAELFRHDAERRNVRLEFNGAVEELSVLSSEEAFSEILSNLIVNAIEAQPNGGRVRVGLSREGDHLAICVEDDGPGISLEARTKMFQPFFTTKATGTGLGLAIVARRVSESGGTIACESPLEGGKGTRFRVMLPLDTSAGSTR
jgi:signal transduction histidine kinase